MAKPQFGPFKSLRYRFWWWVVDIANAQARAAAVAHSERTRKEWRKSGSKAKA